MAAESSGPGVASTTPEFSVPIASVGFADGKGNIRVQRGTK